MFRGWVFRGCLGGVYGVFCCGLFRGYFIRGCAGGVGVLRSVQGMFRTCSRSLNATCLPPATKAHCMVKLPSGESVTKPPLL